MTKPVPDLAAATQDVLRVLERAGLPACLIGGLVVPRWGEPRATTDVDITVLAPYGDEGTALDTLLARFLPRSPDAREFALAHRVLLLKTPNESVSMSPSEPFLSKSRCWTPRRRGRSHLA